MTTYLLVLMLLAISLYFSSFVLVEVKGSVVVVVVLGRYLCDLLVLLCPGVKRRDSLVTKTERYDFLRTHQHERYSSISRFGSNKVSQKKRIQLI